MIMPSILMFAPLCSPADNPEAIVNSKLVAAMLRAGWHVDVITAPSWMKTKWYPSGEKDLFSAFPEAIHAVDLPKKRGIMNVAYCAVSVLTGKELFPPYGSSWSVVAYRQAQRLIRKRHYDFILSRGLPIEAHMSGAVLSAQTGIPWVANWNDPLPLFMAPEPYGGGPGLGFRNRRMRARILSKSLRRLLKKVVNRAAWHTFPCERLRRYICSYLPGDVLLRSSVVPHIALENLRFSREQRTHAFTLCHSGRLEPPRRPDALLTGVKMFLDSQRPHEEFRVRFFGKCLPDIGDISASLGISHVVSTEPGMPYQESLRALFQETVLVVVEAPMDEGIFLPSKLADYVQTGRPILALSPRCSTVSDLLHESGGGISVDCTSPLEIARAIGTLYRAWKGGTLETDFGSHRLWPYFCEDVVIDKYRNLFGRLKNIGRLSMGGSTGERG
jgi:hypothetical protein